MKIDRNLNYTILCNNINDVFMREFTMYQVMGDSLEYKELMDKLQMFPSKQVVFKETWYNLRDNELKYILELLRKQKVKYINVTSNVEEAVYSDYIMVYDNDTLIMEGPKDMILKEEKELKRRGFGLPFAVDLSIQLNYYDVLDKVYYDIPSLMEVLWK